MRWTPDISIVIPAYNEAARLEPTVRATAAYCEATGRRFELFVIDDGSRDNTSAVARTLREEIAEVRLIRLAENRGKGFAVRTGVVNSSGRLVLFADADGATPMAELERLEPAIEQGHDVAIGSRMRGVDEVVVRARLYRHFIGRCFHRLVRTLAVRGFHDTQCGFKLFRAPVAHDLFSRMRMDGFSFDVELLLMAHLQGYRVAEVPVNWVHQPGSKVNLAFDSARMARDLFVIRSHWLRGRYRTPHVASWAEPMSEASDEPSIASSS